MKKNVIIIAAATLAIAAISCNKVATEIETPNTHDDEIVTITASAESATKTTYAGGTDFSWTAGDKISVLCYNSGTDSYKFVDFMATTTAHTSDFTGTPGDGWAVSSKALFPAGSHSYDKSTDKLTFSLDGDKVATGTFSADLPMVGVKDGDVFHFTHCTGAAKITIENIPSKYKTVTIEYSSPSLKLSGDFQLSQSGEYWKWAAAEASTDAEKKYKRKLTVSDNKATMYLPYAWGTEGAKINLYTTNSMVVTGYDNLENATELYNNSSLSGISDFRRASVKALSPLVFNNLKSIDWSDASVYTFARGAYNYRMEEWKATSDEYFIYFRLQIAAWKMPADPSGTYFYTGYNTNGVSNDGVAPEWPTSLEIEPDIEALTLLYPFVSNDGSTITFKDGVDAAGFIQCPVKTATGKLTTYGYQPGDLTDGEYIYVYFAVQRSKIGNPSGSITVQHKGLDGYLSSPGTFTLN